MDHLGIAGQKHQGQQHYRQHWHRKAHTHSKRRLEFLVRYVDDGRKSHHAHRHGHGIGRRCLLGTLLVKGLLLGGRLIVLVVEGLVDCVESSSGDNLSTTLR